MRALMVILLLAAMAWMAAQLHRSTSDAERAIAAPAERRLR